MDVAFAALIDVYIIVCFPSFFSKVSLCLPPALFRCFLSPPMCSFVSLQHCFGFLSSSNCSSMSSCFSAFFFLQCVPLSYSNTVSMFSSSTNNVTLFPSGTVSMLSFFSKVFLCRSQSCFYAFFLILNLHLQFSCLLFFCCHHPPLLSPQLYLPSLLFTSSSSALPP